MKGHTAAEESPPPSAPPTAIPERSPRRSRVSGPRIYYLLAAFDVLTVSASLYLNHRIMQIYLRSVEANQEWAGRMADYADLGRLAADVNAPGNDVFDSHDVALESSRMQGALRAFEERLGLLRAQLHRTVPDDEAARLHECMNEVEQAMDEMVAETRLIFSYFAGGQNVEAGQRMATMDRRYARLLAALRELGAGVSSIQRRQFERQTAAAADLQQFEFVIATLILIMVAAATVYGRRISRQAARDAQERAAHIQQLQTAGESLRRAHDELEGRVEERTRALRESEAALRRAAAEWHRTFEAIESPVMILDRAGRILRINRAAADQAGRREDLVRGEPVESIGLGEPWRCAGQVARQLRDEHGAASAQARDSRSGRTWEVSGNLVPDEEGRGMESAIVVARDVTRLVELQESVLREERMSAMGSLVAGVAHEVRNPLFGISSTLDAFEARHGKTEPFQKYLNVLRREVDRLGALMRDLLDYGKPPVLDLVEVDFEGVVDEAVRLCEADAEAAGVRIVKTSGWGIGELPMDRWRIVQVVQNLIQNAIQHSPTGSAVVVSGGEKREDGRPTAWCSVRDSGPGFDVLDLPRLFEPFFTRRRGGTGLGLSIAQRIVSQHGGVLEAANHPEGGAVVSMRLPLVAAMSPRSA